MPKARFEEKQLTFFFLEIYILRSELLSAILHSLSIENRTCICMHARRRTQPRLDPLAYQLPY